MGPATETLGRRLGVHGLIYASAPFLTVVISLANVAVVTRFLTPGAFGRLAIVLVLGSLLTVLFNIGSLQGTFGVAFGPVVDENGMDIGAAEPETELARRRAMGTGLVITSTAFAVGMLVVVALSTVLARALVGTADAAVAVIWAAAGGGFESLFRLVANLMRYERRPARWLVVYLSRSVVGLGATVALLKSGFGVTGVVAGTALGTGGCFLLGLLLERRRFAVAWSWGVTKRIFALGAPVAPVMIFFWAMGSLDVFFLARTISHRQLGFYRIASRLSGFVVNFSSAYLMAWGPLSRDSVYLAATRERGERSLQTVLTTYLAVGVFWVTLTLALLSNVLVKIAPSSYAGAAVFIPLLALRWIGRAFYQTTYWTAVFEQKRRMFGRVALVSTIVFIPLLAALAPPFGIYGAAAASAVIPFCAGIALLMIAHRAGDRPSFDFRRIGLMIGAAGAVYAAVAWARGFGGWQYVAEAGGVGAYPLTLVLLGVIPLAHLRNLRDWLRLQALRRRSHALGARVASLDETTLETLAAVISRRAEAHTVAERLRVPEDEALSRVVAALRAAAGIDGQGPRDDRLLGRYLLWRGSGAERDHIARELWTAGVDPREIDTLDVTLKELRRQSRLRRRMPPAVGPPAPGLE